MKLAQITKDRGKKKKWMKVKGPAFEAKDYSFSETPTDSTSQFKNRSELFDKYKDDKEVNSNESL